MVSPMAQTVAVSSDTQIHQFHIGHNTPCLPPPPLPRPIICISIQPLSFISLQLDQTSNTITRDAYLANTSYHSLVSIREEAVMTCMPECKGKEEILCLQIVVIVIY